MHVCCSFILFLVSREAGYPSPNGGENFHSPMVDPHPGVTVPTWSFTTFLEAKKDEYE